MNTDKLKSFKNFIGTNTRHDILELVNKVSTEHYANGPAWAAGDTSYLAYNTKNPWHRDNTIRIYNIPLFSDRSLAQRYIQPLLDALNNKGHTVADWVYDYDESTLMAKADLDAGYIDITFKNPYLLKDVN
jgi:hypothetical protein